MNEFEQQEESQEALEDAAFNEATQSDTAEATAHAPNEKAEILEPNAPAQSDTHQQANEEAHQQNLIDESSEIERLRADNARLHAAYSTLQGKYNKEIAEVRSQRSQQTSEDEELSHEDSIESLKEDLPEVYSALEAQKQEIERLRHEQMTKSHFEAIYSKHPDANETVQSDAFQAWLYTNPQDKRDEFNHIINSGTADQVIQMLDTFKQTKAPQKNGSKQSSKAAASAVQTKARPVIPAAQIAENDDSDDAFNSAVSWTMSR